MRPQWTTVQPLPQCTPRLLLLQALSWPHAHGRAHCDIKTDNMAFCMDDETGELSRIQLMDQGGSIKFAGAESCCGSGNVYSVLDILHRCPATCATTKHAVHAPMPGWCNAHVAVHPVQQALLAGWYGRAPPGFTFNKLTASPEVARGMLGDSYVHIDGCAHDCWGVGCIAFLAFSNTWPFHCRPTGSSQQDWMRIHDNHQDWVRLPFFAVLDRTYVCTTGASSNLLYSVCGKQQTLQ